MDQNPQSSYQTTNTLTKLDFNKKYWFTSLQMVEVVNPTAEDYPFMVEMRHFIVKKGANERLPGVIANVYLDQMSKLLAQDDDKLAFMADPQLMKVYFDKLIVDVESLVPEVNNVPAYMRDVPTSAQSSAPEEMAPWEQNMERARSVTPDSAPIANDPRISAMEDKIDKLADIVSTLASSQKTVQTQNPEPVIAKTATMPSLPTTTTGVAGSVLAPPAPEKPQEPAEPTEKQFEYQDNKYKMVTDKNGRLTFFKNGRRTTEAEYAKSASMI